MTDSEQLPAMGFIYGAMDKAKEEIAANLGNEEGAYKEIWKIIDKKGEFQLHRHLHAAILSESPIPIFGWFIQSYRADWWSAYGDKAPELRSFAMKILSLTCSSSACERNLITFNLIEEDRIFEVPIWKQNICYLHTFDRTPRCSICERYQNKEERYIKLADDRILCRDCYSTAIFDEDALKSLQNCLRQFFKKNKVKFHNDIPIFLVDKNDIENLASLRPPNVNYKYFNPPITEGICKAMAYECLVDSWYDPIGKAGEFVEMLRKFRELEFRKQHSRIYGGGFIGARTAIQKFGVKDALKQIYKKTNKGRINATMIMEDDLELDEYDYYD
ncbi:hypothetical protein LWI29_009593 [Acer saccharum]|uniref:HAT C-terminal dimerisation domain-containing protein n=1 Tax=Acer saccharum TaxID=4024 RepID=A0AA39VI16_ACESA|nr:hypothetical protein LWI29_009593 [Acer saccharum]